VLSPVIARGRRKLLRRPILPDADPRLIGEVDCGHLSNSFLHSDQPGHKCEDENLREVDMPVRTGILNACQGDERLERALDSRRLSFYREVGVCLGPGQ
jgi:hypothetical protein